MFRYERDANGTKAETKKTTPAKWSKLPYKKVKNGDKTRNKR